MSKIPMEVFYQGREPPWVRRFLHQKLSSVPSAGIGGVSLMEGAMGEDSYLNHIGPAT